jgi:hypothetical protein
MPQKYNTDEERIAARREQERLRMARKQAAAREEAVAAPPQPAALEYALCMHLLVRTARQN